MYNKLNLQKGGVLNSTGENHAKDTVYGTVCTVLQHYKTRLCKYIYMTYLGMFQSVHSLFQFCSIGVDLQAVDDTVLGELIAYYNVLVLDRITVSALVCCLIL